MQLDRTATFGAGSASGSAIGAADAPMYTATSQMAEAQTAADQMELYDGPALTFENVPDRHWDAI